MDYKQILRSLVAVFLAVLIAANTASGIRYESVEALVVAILLLSVFNVFLKPLLMLFSLPFIILTFGLGIWIINALLFLLAAAMVNGFYVESFMSALWGALLLSIMNIVAMIYFGGSKNSRVSVRFQRSGRFPGANLYSDGSRISRQSRAGSSIQKDDDVIDI